MVRKITQLCGRHEADLSYLAYTCGFLKPMQRPARSCKEKIFQGLFENMGQNRALEALRMPQPVLERDRCDETAVIRFARVGHAPVGEKPIRI